MKLSLAITTYLNYRANGWSASTVRNDRKVLNKLIAHTGDVKLASLTPEVMDEFLQSKPMNPDSPSTYNLYFSALRNFFRWARQRKYIPIDFDPLVGQRVKKKPEVARFRVPMEEFPALLDAAATPRDRMIIAIGLYLMVRESEARSIRLGDLNLHEGTVAVTVHKTKQFDLMPISSELDAELRQYLVWYAAQHGKLEDDWYLIPQSKLTNRFQVFEMNPTKCLGSGGMSRPIQKAVTKLGYNADRVGMHTLRRSAAAAVFLEKTRMGYDGALRQVSAWLHHKSQRTSEIYIGIDIDKNTRNEETKAQSLYPSLSGGNVVRMSEYHGDYSDQAV